MVHQIRLMTQCASTMMADVMLSGLLHGRWHTPTPSLLPPCTLKDFACPWTGLAVSENQQPLPLQKPTYSDVLQVPPPKNKHLCHCVQYAPPINSPMPSSWKISYARCLQNGSWQWQSLAHRIDLLLSPPIISPTPTPTNPNHFDTITQWLPTLCLIAPPPSTTDNPTHETNNPIPDTDYPADSNSFDCDDH
jgi:hypothetical protein